jgi:hypothetical protein
VVSWHAAGGIGLSLVLGDAGQMRMAGSNGKTGPDVDFFIYTLIFFKKNIPSKLIYKISPFSIS